jgi:hypothetical protein
VTPGHEKCFTLRKCESLCANNPACGYAAHDETPFCRRLYYIAEASGGDQQFRGGKLGACLAKATLVRSE